MDKTEEQNVREAVVVLRNRHGMHLRLASEVTKRCHSFGVQAFLGHDTANARLADANSMLSMLALNAPFGAKLRIRTLGGKAREALDSLVSLLQDESFG